MEFDEHIRDIHMKIIDLQNNSSDVEKIIEIHKSFKKAMITIVENDKIILTIKDINETSNILDNIREFKKKVNFEFPKKKLIIITEGDEIHYIFKYWNESLYFNQPIIVNINQDLKQDQVIQNAVVF